MTQSRFNIVAAPEAKLLCKLIGLLAQLDLPAPDLTVSVAAGQMVVDVRLAGFGGAQARIIASKMAQMVGVETVTLDGDGD